eukprot:CAMPEP_0117442808 /NCGR_PEP_ID=MMETSP0759-20121206/4353_1 /TAXON_ID=63605 /ORGANISM="Percolomonas cosmopolitus, Strain WS" /LENGTH=100 /DNA_ID=CAMNT_0005234729 /DNA_START=38 /DNA_END=340 /DNA_ORIENTATION=+
MSSNPIAPRTDRNFRNIPITRFFRLGFMSFYTALSCAAYGLYWYKTNEHKFQMKREFESKPIILTPYESALVYESLLPKYQEKWAREKAARQEEDDDDEL